MLSKFCKDELLHNSIRIRGVSHKVREIWRIPEFIMLDDNGIDKYVVRNLLVAIVDDSQIQSFNMVLSTTVFHGSLYTVCDKNKDKHFEVDSEYNRPVYCVPGNVGACHQRGTLSVNLREIDWQRLLIRAVKV